MTVYSQGLMDSRQEMKVLQNRISDGFSRQFIPGVFRIFDRAVYSKAVTRKKKKKKKTIVLTCRKCYNNICVE